MSQVGCSVKSLSLFDGIINENPWKQPARMTINEYKNLSDKGKEDANKDYIEKKWRSELHNRDCFLWLWELYQSEKDHDLSHAIETKLAQFKRAILAQENPYPALRLDFKEKYILKTQEEKIDWNE